MAYQTIPASVGASSIAITGDGLDGDGSALDPLALVPATALAAGSLSAVDFSKLATVPTGGLIPVAFMSDVIDLAAVADTPFGGNWVTMPGYKLVNFISRWVITNVAATTFASGPTVTLGNDASFLNINGATANLPSATNLNAFLAGGGAGGPYGLVASNGPTAGPKMPDLTVVPTVRVSVAATGTSITQCKARLFVFGQITSALTTI